LIGVTRTFVILNEVKDLIGGDTRSLAALGMTVLVDGD